MYTGTFYALQAQNGKLAFHPMLTIVRKLKQATDKILRLEIAQAPDGVFWAWWSNKSYQAFPRDDSGFRIMGHKMADIEKSFPEGMIAAMEAGYGRVMQVKVVKMDVVE